MTNEELQKRKRERASKMTGYAVGGDASSWEKYIKGRISDVMEYTDTQAEEQKYQDAQRNVNDIIKNILI